MSWESADDSSWALQTVAPEKGRSDMVAASKRRLNEFRVGKPQLNEMQEYILKKMRGDPHFDAGDDYGLPIDDLRNVLLHDSWNGYVGQNAGPSWVAEWVKWGQEFTDSSCAYYGKTEKKKLQNWEWYRGNERPPGAMPIQVVLGLTDAEPPPPARQASGAIPPPPPPPAALCDGHPTERKTQGMNVAVSALATTSHGLPYASGDGGGYGPFRGVGHDGGSRVVGDGGGTCGASTVQSAESRLATVAAAKRRLNEFRRGKPQLDEWQEYVVKKLRSNPHMSTEEECGLPLRDLLEVLDNDSWNEHTGDIGWQWISNWLAWGPEFSDPAYAYHGKTEEKRLTMWRWYHGDAPPPSQMDVRGSFALASASGSADSRPASLSEKNLADLCWTSEQKIEKKEEDAGSCSSASEEIHMGPRIQAEIALPFAEHTALAAASVASGAAASSLNAACLVGDGALVASPLPAAPCDAVIAVQVEDDSVADMFASSFGSKEDGVAQGSSFSSTAKSKSSSLADLVGFAPARLEGELSRPHMRDETTTIASLTSADTIPLGTDLDPRNAYDNKWMATKAPDRRTALLIRFNLGCRVVDGENVGFSYGKEVLKKDRFYSEEGVYKAVEHFSRQAMDVILVTRRDKWSRPFGENVHVVKAESTDDIMVLKQAWERNSPVVSRDSYATWLSDKRIDRDLRSWAADATDLQIRFSWGQRGDFIADFDLPRPVLKAGVAQLCQVRCNRWKQRRKP